MLEKCNRHDIIRIRPERTSDAVRVIPAGEHGRIINWLARYPMAVVRRPRITSDQKRICCGVVLPLEEGKRRFAFEVALSAVAELQPPPRLAACLEHAAPGWREPLQILAEMPGPLALAFGSLAWQYLTGLRYITDESDADILFRPASITEWRELEKELISWRGKYSSVPVDIEITFPNGFSTAWKEYLAGTEKLLFKTGNNVVLMGRANIGNFFHA